MRYPHNHRAFALRFLGCIEWLTGRLDAAAETANRAVLEAGDHLPSLFFVLINCSAVVAIERRDWSAAARYIDVLYRRCGHHAFGGSGRTLSTQYSQLRWIDRGWR